MLAAPVVEANVVLQPAFPMSQLSWAHGVPKFLLNGTLDPLHLAIEVRRARSDAGVADAQTLQQASEIAAELGTVVRLDTVHREGQVLQQTWEDAAHGGCSALF
ncbi:MAG: hypothetical protein A2Y61_07950 [Chloroflexi bacterium RBG_13_60_13]|nr:MAG: hypothetical protein A2Y61_07950 [Chloroflexi bacterium RBG_13_60_13]